jgi:hypothetical protein
MLTIIDRSSMDKNGKRPAPPSEEDLELARGVRVKLDKLEVDARHDLKVAMDYLRKCPFACLLQSRWDAP